MPNKMNETILSDDQLLEHIVEQSFPYFIKEVNEMNGLVADKNQEGSTSSIAVTGIAICCYLAAIENGLLSRKDAVKKVITVLRFFNEGHQGPEADAMGYKGFYYHFLNMNTGRRVDLSELSTVDTAFFVAGALTAASYFTADDKDETEIRSLAEALYLRVDWQWALNGSDMICHGWKPESGFLEYYWDCHYSEALLLYILALGSASFPIDKKGYDKWISTFQLKKVYDIEYIYAGPLFIHQLSHIWIDFKGISDDMNRKVGFDYFENSRRATIVHKEYAIKNENKFIGYGEYCWGLSACDGPGPATMISDGKEREFHDYLARGAPFGPDDGTVAPWASVASLPFAPKIVLDILRFSNHRLEPGSKSTEGFVASYNPTFNDGTMGQMGWVAEWRFGLNQGPIILMVENYRSRLIWDLMKKCPAIIRGLSIAGFTGGWLDEILNKQTGKSI